MVPQVKQSGASDSLCATFSSSSIEECTERSAGFAFSSTTTSGFGSRFGSTGALEASATMSKISLDERPEIAMITSSARVAWMTRPRSADEFEDCHPC